MCKTELYKKVLDTDLFLQYNFAAVVSFIQYVNKK